MNCLNRAYVGAGTTIGTYIRVNLIDITFGYCLNRTFIDACAASSAIIIDFVSHLYNFWFLLNIIDAQKYLNFLNRKGKIKIIPKKLNIVVP